MSLKIKYLILFFILFITHISFSQKKDLYVSDSISITKDVINPIAPSKAAFYAAILPGLGQAYNKKYWKIPIVYGVLGTSTGFYIYNNKQYNRFRSAFKLMKANKPHEFDGVNGNVLLSEEALENAQKRFKEDKDLSLFITVGLYVLQIVEASVDAHLMQLNTNDDLSFNPNIIIDPITNKITTGISITYSF